VAGETCLRLSARRASARPPHVVAWTGNGISDSAVHALGRARQRHRG
jgi:hypothetical protein